MDREALAREALNKALSLTESLEERYREALLPVVFQFLTSTAGAPLTVNETVQRPQDSSGNTGTAPGKLLSNISINEFMKRAAPQTQTDLVVCAAYYLFHVERLEQFGYTELRDIFGKLREKEPKNLTDVVNRCLKNAHLKELPGSTNGQRRLVITPTGENYVEKLLEGRADDKK